MTRHINQFAFPENELEITKQRMLQWANQSNILCFFDNNEYQHTSGVYECLCAKSALAIISDSDANFSELKAHFAQKHDWLFGHINYDFKNKLERLTSAKEAHFEFPEIQFFQPEVVCYILRKENIIHIESATENPADIWQTICKEKITALKPSNQPFAFEKRIQEQEYKQKIALLKQHIVQGDCYEINFCNEAFTSAAVINPLATFLQLNKRSKAPFAAFYKANNQYLICASPERYLQKIGNKITAQPIKGTAKRASDILLDEELKRELLSSKKERAENVMIVDLMRNDLARCCRTDSIIVEELFGVYSFPQVHQLISTISGTLNPELSPFDALKLSFPMGSMTGAPKIMVMKLIEQYEQARRELYAGTVGYISPSGDFDFNVVIRSLLYNAETKYLSYQTGGAITYDSIPEAEWEETLLKGSAIEKIFA